jgi:Ca2+/Na+ antiporter
VAFGIDEFIIGTTVVAIGTSTPELTTKVIAKFRKQDEVGLGTILGSSIFNGLLVIGVASIMHPIAVDQREVAVTLAFGLIALVFTYPLATGLHWQKAGDNTVATLCRLPHYYHPVPSGQQFAYQGWKKQHFILLPLTG